jgi:hypothetical protein
MHFHSILHSLKHVTLDRPTVGPTDIARFRATIVAKNIQTYRIENSATPSIVFNCAFSFTERWRKGGKDNEKLVSIYI